MIPFYGSFQSQNITIVMQSEFSYRLYSNKRYDTYSKFEFSVQHLFKNLILLFFFFFFFLIAQVLTILQTDFMDVFLQHAT